MKARSSPCLEAIQPSQTSLAAHSRRCRQEQSHDEQTCWQLGMGVVGRRAHRRRYRRTLAERKEPYQRQAEEEIRRDAGKAAQAHGGLDAASSSTGEALAMAAHKFKAGQTVRVVPS